MKSDDKPPVTRDSDKFMLRFPDGMRDQITQAAKANGRSMNAEIIARLADSLETTKGPRHFVAMSPDFATDLFKQLDERIETIVYNKMVDVSHMQIKAVIPYKITDPSDAPTPAPRKRPSVKKKP